MYKRVRWSLTAFIGSGAQPGLCFIVMKAVEPEVSDLRVGPNPPRLRRNTQRMRHEQEHFLLTYEYLKLFMSVDVVCPTFLGAQEHINHSYTVEASTLEIAGIVQHVNTKVKQC